MSVRDGVWNMKRVLSIGLFIMVGAVPALAQTTTTGGGPDVTVQSTKGTRVVGDTTSHTTHGYGVTVSGSTGRDGKPNGSSGSASDAPAGPGGASYEGP